MRIFTDKLFYDMPGAWYGAAPWHAVIDPTKIVEALAFCRRHKLVVIETALTDLLRDPAIVLRFKTTDCLDQKAAS